MRDLAIQPSSENTLAVDQGEYNGISIYDFDPVARTATARGASTDIYTGTCLAFPDPNSLFSIDLELGALLRRYTVSATGLRNGSYPYYTGTVSDNLECYKLDNGLLFSTSGGVFTASDPVTQIGTFEGMNGIDSYGIPVRRVEADTSLGRVFFMTNDQPYYALSSNAISTYDLKTYMPVAVLPVNFAVTGGNTDPAADTNSVDLVRWGQDGLAALTTSRQLYLLRGAAIVPQLLNANGAATLNALSTNAIAHSSGNTTLTLTGSNFVPGVVVTWNGSYRFTRIVDGTHVSVAIPASDLAQPGMSTLSAINPGAPSSASLTLNVQ